jgi:hypothetical protein
MQQINLAFSASVTKIQPTNFSSIAIESLPEEIVVLGNATNSPRVVFSD